MRIWRWLAWTVGVVAATAACAVAVAMNWGPLAKPDLTQASTLVVPAEGVHPPAALDDVLAIIYSGDGGWADLDRQLGGAFAAQGVPVVGINTFTYFWRERSPEVAAAQLDALITQYVRQWGKPRVWLLGYSFGANVLPTLARQLGPDNRARVAQLVLLSPERDLSFEIQFQSYMLGNGRLKAFVKTALERVNPVPESPALPTVLALADTFAVACYYGTEESDESLCTQAQLPPWVTVHARVGGHHLGQDYQGLARELMARLPAAASERPGAGTGSP